MQILFQILFCFSPLNVRYGYCCCRSHDAKHLLEKVGIKSPGPVMQMGSACFSMKLAIVISVFFYEKVFFSTEKWGNFWNFFISANYTNFANFWDFFCQFFNITKLKKRKEKKRKEKAFL
jgi:hypothetical protein